MPAVQKKSTLALILLTMSIEVQELGVTNTV
jgi:hypothetical protein